MAAGTYYATNYTAQFITVPPELTHASKQGKTETWFDEATIGTDVDSGTVITFFKPPKGSRLIGGTLFAGAQLTSTTLSVGTSVQSYDRKTDIRDVDYDDAAGAEAASATTFLTATAAASASKTDLFPAALQTALGYEFDGDTTITVTVAGAACVAATKVALMIKLIMP